MTTPQHSYELAASTPEWLANGAPIRLTAKTAYQVRDIVTVLKAAFADPDVVRPATRFVNGAGAAPEPVTASVSLHADEGDGTPDGFRVQVAAYRQDYWLASRLIRPAGPAIGVGDLECILADAVAIANAMLHSWDDLVYGP